LYSFRTGFFYELQTPEYKDYMEEQPLKPIFLTGNDILKFLEEDDALNKSLMTDAGFVAK
jgi:putative tricarboxylic transport membrane protein